MRKKLNLLLLILCLIVSGAGTVYLFYPDVYLARPYQTEICTEEGEKLYSYIRGFPGEYVPLSEVSPCFIETLIEVEDRQFFHHRGFDYSRILQSAVANLRSGELSQGASTITQQLARMIYLSNEKSWSRKISEAFIAKKIEDKYTKEYILELYINSVYFAHNLYGLSAASDFYFRKTPSQLNYQESCLLVGIINAPGLYSPFLDAEASYRKQSSIAYLLYARGIITIDEYYQIIRNPTPLYGAYEATDRMTDYYIGAVHQELTDRGILSKEPDGVGLSVSTYLDADVQSVVRRAVSRYEFSDQVAIVIMKPYSGKVVALCGGKSYAESEFNRALQGNKSVGSTLKPLIYYLGLLYGMSPLTEFTSEPTAFTLPDGTVYAPRNAGDIYANRPITMAEAIAMSDNIYAVKTTLYVGTETIAGLLKSFGITADTSDVTLSLGNIEMTPLELASIYNTFASEGVYYAPKFVASVTDALGVRLYEASSSGTRVLKYDECIMMNYLLQAPLDTALTTYSTPTMRNYQVNTSFAVKTGTTESSSWTVGFNPDYTVLVYVGQDDGEALSDGTVSKKIWRDIVNELTLGAEDSFYNYTSTLKAFRFHNFLYNLLSKPYLRKK